MANMSAFLTDPLFWFNILVKHNILFWMSDEEILKKKYKMVFHKELDLDNPKTYNEKLQWLKLYDRKPVYSKMVDKYEVKKIVAEKIGSEYLIPTYGIWDKYADIDFSSLPNQFVLKCTHDSGGLVIVNDKHKFDEDAAKAKINHSLGRNYYYTGREWPYKNVKPRIIAEAYMEDERTAELRDYKFFCFNGVPRTLFIATDRQTEGKETKFDFFDMDFNHLDVRNGHENADKEPEKPKQFELMKQLAAKLSQGIPQLRVDFYEVNGRVYFGELTFFHWSGFKPFEPEKWDRIFGNWITLPGKTI